MKPWVCKECERLLDDDGICGECIVPEQYDSVNKPFHYNHAGIECIDYIKQILGPEGFVDYCRGNMIKYNHRAFYKGNPKQDMLKAQQYLEWANETLEEIYG
jgi:hypothetical protein